MVLVTLFGSGESVMVTSNNGSVGPVDSLFFVFGGFGVGGKRTCELPVSLYLGGSSLVKSIFFLVDFIFDKYTGFGFGLGFGASYPIGAVFPFGVLAG